MSQTTTSQPVPEEGVEPDGINTPALVMWGFVSVVITVSLMLAAAALFFQAQNRLDEERVIAPLYFDAEKVISDQRGVLSSYASPNAEGQPYKIPIDIAQELILAEAQSEAAD